MAPNFSLFRRSVLPQVLSALVMSLLLALANALFRYPINRYLTWGTPVIALTFAVNELTHLKIGTQAAARSVVVGFLGGLFFTLWVAPGQLALASAASFLSAQCADLFLFRRLRTLRWWVAPFFASALATFLDTALFFTLAFWQQPQDVGPLIAGDLIAKLLLDCVLLVPFRIAASPTLSLALTPRGPIATPPAP